MRVSHDLPNSSEKMNFAMSAASGLWLSGYETENRFDNQLIYNEK